MNSYLKVKIDGFPIPKGDSSVKGPKFNQYVDSCAEKIYFSITTSNLSLEKSPKRWAGRIFQPFHKRSRELTHHPQKKVTKSRRIARLPFLVENWACVTWINMTHFWEIQKTQKLVISQLHFWRCHLSSSWVFRSRTREGNLHSMKHVASPCVVFPTWFSVNASTLPETEMSNLARSEEHWKSKYRLSGLPFFLLRWGCVCRPPCGEQTPNCSVWTAEKREGWSIQEYKLERFVFIFLVIFLFPSSWLSLLPLFQPETYNFHNKRFRPSKTRVFPSMFLLVFSLGR